MPVRPTATMQAALDRDAPEPLRRWASRLPDIVGEMLAPWQLTTEDPYQPGGQCSWTAPAGDVARQIGCL